MRPSVPSSNRTCGFPAYGSPSRLLHIRERQLRAHEWGDERCETHKTKVHKVVGRVFPVHARRPLFLFDEGTQTHANPAVEPHEAGRAVAMPEVVAPATDDGTHGSDGLRDVLRLLPTGESPNLVFEGQDGLAARPAFVAVELLEAVSEEVKACLVVRDHGLFFGELQLEFRELGANKLHGGDRLVDRPAEDDEVIGIAHELESRPLHDMVEIVQVQVGEDGRDDAPLGRSGGRGAYRPFLHDARAKELPDEVGRRTVGNGVPDFGHEELLIERTEEVADVRVNDVGVSLIQIVLHLADGLMRAFARTEPETAGTEARFELRSHGNEDCLLQYAVSDGGNAERSGFPVRFGNFHPTDRQWPVRSLSERAEEFSQIRLKVTLVMFQADSIYASAASIAFDGNEGGAQRLESELVGEHGGYWFLVSSTFICL